MLEQLNADLKRETEDIQETERASENLTQILEQLQEELKPTKRQRIRDLMKHPDQEALIEETYDDLETELAQKIHGIKHQIDLSTDKRNTIIRVNRVAKTALDVFDDILNKKTLERNDLILMVDKIIVFEDHIELQLKADIDQIIRCGTLQAAENCAINFKHGTKAAIVPSIPSCCRSRPTKIVLFALSLSFVDNFPPMGNNNIRIRNIDKERVPYESYRYRPPHRLFCYNKTKPRNPDKSMVFADFVQIKFA